MATRSLPKPARATAPASPPPETGYTEDTGPRIRAFLSAVRPMRGVADIAEGEAYQNGRGLIERLAACSLGTDYPHVTLMLNQCADVLSFLANSEPLEPRGWWKEPKDGPSHLVGLQFVLETLEESVRRRGVS